LRLLLLTWMCDVAVTSALSSGVTLWKPQKTQSGAV
jgi:hypothetical protein